MSAGLGDELGRLGSKVAARLSVGDWEALAEPEQLEVRSVLADLEHLLAKQLAGADVSRDVALCRATLRQWESAALSRVRSAIVAAVEEFVIEVTDVLGAVVIGLIA